MKTVLLGYDDGSKSFLGRSQAPNMVGDDTIEKVLKRKWEAIKQETAKTDAH